VLNICLARWFPQPDLDLIQRTSPPKFKKKFASQLVGTVKYFTIYVSPAFSGRISDPQICYACANYADLADGDEMEVLDSEDVNSDELWN
jgi:hypothetical protein